jgi:hypothetical protein
MTNMSVIEKMNYLEKLTHSMHPSVVAQVEKAFRCILGEDPKLKHGLVLNQSAIECGRLSDIELIHHCIERKVPLVVRTNALESWRENHQFFFLNPLDKSGIRIYSLGRCHGDVFIVPIESLTVDLDFDYMGVVTTN